ncbi:hypothetical protein [Microbacterium sp. CIAB417]|uniref:hypothetical protein n=1 Tax=Microbacterium sp. CIAB417 TaxID=2860287 RepID=UPI001FABC3E6|nr:hypothetical protein [Microbacterium sp. CIAB417]
MPNGGDAASARPARRGAARTGVATAALLIAALALAGCGAQPRPAPSATALPSGITATLLPATPAQGADEVRLWVENTTDENLALTRIRIDAPGFAGIGRKVGSGSIEVEAGQSAEIVVSLPQIRCEADASAPAGADAAPVPTPSPSVSGASEDPTATIGFALGAAIGVAVTPLADPEGVVAARIAAACAAAPTG